MEEYCDSNILYPNNIHNGHFPARGCQNSLLSNKGISGVQCIYGVTIRTYNSLTYIQFIQIVLTI